MAHSEDDKDDEAGKRSRMDRREFGKILVAGVGGLTLGKLAGAGVEESSATGEQLNVDVAIVGAGLSGLIAARELKRAGKSVIVLEANDKIGGRMVGNPTQKVKGGYLDYGGQWVGETQYEMIGLAAELKIPLFLSYEQGRSIQSWKAWKEDTVPPDDIYKDRVDTGFNGDVSDLLEGCTKPDEKHFPKEYLKQCDESPLKGHDCVHNADEERIWNALLDISETVIPDRPWATKDAEVLDKMTFHDWLKDKMGAKDYTKWLPTLQSRIGGSGGFEPDQVSLLHMAWTQRVGPQSETPEKWLLCGGAGQIPGRLAENLANEIRVNTQVIAIEDFANSAYVRANSRKDISSGYNEIANCSAKAVIVAIPPSLRNKISFRTAPGSYADFAASDYGIFSKNSPMGSMSKVHAVYEDAFWRKQCLSGSAAGNLLTCEFIADSSSPGGTPGILTSFIAGKRNEEIMKLSEGDVRDLVLRDFAYYFGKEALNPVEFFYRNWNKQWSGGAFTNHLGPNIWTKYGEEGWRKPVGNIFWAGTETSDRWPGYFDGAVRAGRTAAMAVLERLTESIPKCP